MNEPTDIEKIERWLSASNWSETTLGMRAIGNAHAIRRIRDKGASIKTRDAVMKYIESHPPKAGATQ